MFLQQFYSIHNKKIFIQTQQASLFAKEVAGDFNPLHDPKAKRFCVPGDLLFALVLSHYGLSQNMHFAFVGMVGRGVYLNFPETNAENFDITGDKGKIYLRITRSGQINNSPDLIKTFIRNYVAFSGLNFPHVLVPLMAKQNVMFNTERPLVIYESMSFKFTQMNFSKLQMQATETEFNFSGKRGNVRLHFNVKDNNKLVGCGFKKMLITGIREYNHDVMQRFTVAHLKYKAKYLATFK